MSKRLLSALFPNFVKKEHIQSQRLSQGPFGAGLKKGRKYLKPGEKAPEGANVQTGPQGGQYYDEMGGGGAAAPDAAQGGYDLDYGDPERSAQVREELDQQGMGVPPAPEAGPEISEDRNVVGGIDYGPAKPEIQPEDVDYGPADKGTSALQDSKDYLNGTADAWAEQMTNDPAFTGSEAQIDAAVADLESEIKSQDSDLPLSANSHLDHSNGNIDEDGNWTAPLNEESQQLVDEFRDKLSSGGGAQGGQTSPPDVSEATFDGQGNIQLPGSDPYPIGELMDEGASPEDLSLLTDAYEKESGTEVPGILEGYTGPLNMDSFNQYASDQAQYEEAFVGEKDMYDAEDFFDWMGSKAEADTGAVDEDGFPAGSSPTGEERRAKREATPAAPTAEAQKPTPNEAPTKEIPDRDAYRRGTADAAYYDNWVWEYPGQEGLDEDGNIPKDHPIYARYDNFSGTTAVKAKKAADKVIARVGDHLMDQGTSNDPAEISDAIDHLASELHGYKPGSETYGRLQDEGQRFMAERKKRIDRLGTEDYYLMAKMSQKYNVDNKRRDPVILSNKGGRQRK